MPCSYILLSLLLTLAFEIQDATSSAVNLAALMNVTNDCECSPNLISGRIVGGEETKEHAYPWLVALLRNGAMHCGGSIINTRYILTAGHCLNWSTKEELKVILGMHDRILMEKEHKGATAIDVERIIVHEDYSSDFLHDTNDIGLVKVVKPIVYTDVIRPICLPIGGLNPEYKGHAIVAGWGRTSQGGDPSRHLQQAKLTVLSNHDCKKLKIVSDHIIPSMLCAYATKVDACQGDSGGPLIFESRGRMEQIGVVSWGIGCAKPGVPGVYVRVTSYLEWILAHSRDGVYCTDTQPR